MPHDPQTPDFITILDVLTESGVDFIIVGGVCAVLHGVPVATFDLDIVHRRTTENIDRLLVALDKLEAKYRTDPRGLRPAHSHLESPGHQLLTTRAGLLDVLGAIDDGAAYEDLIDRTVELRLESHVVRVLSLEALLEIKRRAGRPKDLAALALLEHTLAESRTDGE